MHILAIFVYTVFLSVCHSSIWNSLVSCPVSDTSCPTGTSCCSAGYSSTGYGCCPYQNAVCCSNNQTCCEAGSTCVLNGPYLTTCVSATGNKTGISVCKPGPTVPPSTTLTNVMVMGDSISIGYTPYVSKGLQQKYQVVHTPADTSDGGAEETAYGLQCLNYFLSTSTQQSYHTNIILFNWGLHNTDNSTVPGQSGPAADYAPQLAQLVEKLYSIAKASNIKLIWVTTTPVPFSADYNQVVISHNTAASDIMAKYNIPQVDLYTEVIKYCGPVPFWNCEISLNSRGSNNVHYRPQGYQYLANFLVDAVEKEMNK